MPSSFPKWIPTSHGGMSCGAMVTLPIYVKKIILDAFLLKTSSNQKKIPGIQVTSSCSTSLPPLGIACLFNLAILLGGRLGFESPGLSLYHPLPSPPLPSRPAQDGGVPGILRAAPTPWSHWTFSTPQPRRHCGAH